MDWIFERNLPFPQTKSWKHTAWDEKATSEMQLLGETIIIGRRSQPIKVSYFVQYGDGEDRVVHTVKIIHGYVFTICRRVSRIQIIHMDISSLSQLPTRVKQDALYYRKEKGKIGRYKTRV